MPANLKSPEIGGCPDALGTERATNRNGETCQLATETATYIVATVVERG